MNQTSIIKVSHQISDGQAIQISQLLELVGWNQRQINGQIEAITKFIDGKDSVVLFAINCDEVIGYACAQFYSWNRLGQIHGLVVHPNFRRKGLASALIKEVEAYMRANQARGVYVDTPTNNMYGCAFYKGNHFKEAYIMPEYYDEGIDGVTFLKFLNK
jgi:ribosomal protein S18 acetylase RimI-like enzyme